MPFTILCNRTTAAHTCLHFCLEDGKARSARYYIKPTPNTQPLFFCFKSYQHFLKEVLTARQRDENPGMRTDCAG